MPILSHFSGFYNKCHLITHNFHEISTKSVCDDCTKIGAVPQKFVKITPLIDAFIVIFSVFSLILGLTVL